MRKGTPGVFLAAALALSVGNAAAVPYSFTNIADSSGPFDFFGTPSLNNSGTVAFVASWTRVSEASSPAAAGPPRPSPTPADHSTSLASRLSQRQRHGGVLRPPGHG